jgi:hypothetical protein
MLDLFAYVRVVEEMKRQVEGPLEETAPTREPRWRPRAARLLRRFADRLEGPLADSARP